MEDDRRKVLVFGVANAETNITNALDLDRYDIRTPFEEWDRPKHNVERNCTTPISSEFISAILTPSGRDAGKYFAAIIDYSFMEALPIVRGVGYGGLVVAITSGPFDADKKEKIQPPLDEQKEWICGVPEGADAAVSVYPMIKFEDKLNLTLDKLAREK